MIYFIGIEGTDYVKVGRAIDVGKRLASLATAHPLDLSILHVIKTSSHLEDTVLEKQIHTHLKERRTKREWFELDRQTLIETINHFENGEAYADNPIFEGRYLCLRAAPGYVEGGELPHAVTEPCFFCRVKHFHGLPKETQIINGVHTYGHRVAHCHIRHVQRWHPSGTLLDNAYGYYLWVEHPESI